MLGGLNGSTIVDGGSCGREVARSTGNLRRFKWGIGGAAKVIVAESRFYDVLETLLLTMS